MKWICFSKLSLPYIITHTKSQNETLSSVSEKGNITLYCDQAYKLTLQKWNVQDINTKMGDVYMLGRLKTTCRGHQTRHRFVDFQEKQVGGGGCIFDIQK